MTTKLSLFLRSEVMEPSHSFSLIDIVAILYVAQLLYLYINCIDILNLANSQFYPFSARVSIYPVQLNIEACK